MDQSCALAPDYWPAAPPSRPLISVTCRAMVLRSDDESFSRRTSSTPFLDANQCKAESGTAPPASPIFLGKLRLGHFLCAPSLWLLTRLLQDLPGVAWSSEAHPRLFDEQLTADKVGRGTGVFAWRRGVRAIERPIAAAWFAQAGHELSLLPSAPDASLEASLEGPLVVRGSRGAWPRILQNSVDLFAPVVIQTGFRVDAGAGDAAPALTTLICSRSSGPRLVYFQDDSLTGVPGSPAEKISLTEFGRQALLMQQLLPAKISICGLGLSYPGPWRGEAGLLVAARPAPRQTARTAGGASGRAESESGAWCIARSGLHFAAGGRDARRHILRTNAQQAHFAGGSGAFAG